MSDVSVIILNWNTRELVARCLREVEAHAEGLSLELIVADNASSDGTVEMVRRDFPHVKVVETGGNVGFARGNNLAVRAATGRYHLLLNSDAFPRAGALRALVDVLDRQPQAGLAGARLLNADGSFQAGHTLFPTLGRELLILTGLGRVLFGRHYPSAGPEVPRGARPVDYVEGACLLCRPEAYAQVGGLDEGFFMYAEEVDLCMALRRAGWQVWYVPEAEVTHLGGASSAGRKPEREADLYVSRVRFFRKHYGPFRARLLSALILATTAAKVLLHGLLRTLTGGRRGRAVVAVGHLAKRLNQAVRA